MRIRIHQAYVLGKLKEALFASFIGVVAGLGAALLDILKGLL